MDNNEKGIDQRNLTALNQALSYKINYLTRFKAALRNRNDLVIYRLLDSRAYRQAISGQKALHDSKTKWADLVLDLAPRLSHYLSYNLIDYLGRKYPFFYYEEYQLGRFNIYFGNWWDHQLFGKLDVLHVRFIFESQAWDQLKRAFRLKSGDHQVNSIKIKRLIKASHHEQALMASQSQREGKKIRLQEDLKVNDSKSHLPWNSNRIKNKRDEILKQLSLIDKKDRQATSAKDKIKDNEHRILNLSKEDTVLGYEKQSIQRTFGNFQEFIRRNHHLYRDYILRLAKKAQVKDNHERK